MKECKYCNNIGDKVSYREKSGQVNKELVCDICHNLTNEVLKLKANRRNMSEGDDYWALENDSLVLSCWDEESVLIGNKDVFLTLEDGLEFAKAIGMTKVKAFDYKLINPIEYFLVDNVWRFE